MSQAGSLGTGGSGGGGITSITGDSGGAQTGPAITLVGASGAFSVDGVANTFTISYTDPSTVTNLNVLSVLNTTMIDPTSGQGLLISLQGATDTFTVKDSALANWFDIDTGNAFVSIGKNVNSGTFVNGSLEVDGSNVAIVSSDTSPVTLYPQITLQKGTTTTSPGNQVSDIISQGLDDTSNAVVYADISGYCVSNTTGSATGKMTLGVAVNSAITTKITIISTGCQIYGNNANTAPSTGQLGEQVRATVAQGTPVSLSNGIAKNVTSISIGAGTWDISGVIGFTGTSAVATTFTGSVNTTTDTLGTLGDNSVTIQAGSLAVNDASVTIPSWRLTTASTTVYLVAKSDFGAGTVNGYGRISATRVA